MGAKERVEEARANLEARHLAAPPGSRECLTETQIWTDLCRETVNPAKVEAGRGSLTACRGAHGVSWMCHGTSSVHAPGTGSFRGRHRAPKSRLNKLLAPPTPKCVYFLGHVPCVPHGCNISPLGGAERHCPFAGVPRIFLTCFLHARTSPAHPQCAGELPEPSG